MLKLRKNKKGFTLVELIVVIAIMAVLAGTVAGVTVSQLNKQTDKSNQSQAKGIADFVSTYIVEQDFITTGTGDTEIFDNTKLTAFNTALTKQYSNVKTDGIDTEKGTFSVVVTQNKIYVLYNGKQSGKNGDIYYEVDTEGVITTKNDQEVSNMPLTALTAPDASENTDD